MKRTLAILGGSGLYGLPQLEVLERHDVETPYGKPSDSVLRARLPHSTDVELLFLPRHGRGHRLPPHRINYRANVCALKMLGAEAILSVSACGSMRESIAPGDLVVVDQMIDLTRARPSTFFDELVAHVAFSDPICPVLSGAVYDAVARVRARRPKPDFDVHRGGTYLCIDGPQFSTRAESLLYRSWGVALIGMTNMPEAKLAREAELPYATLGLATDYDCWHESEAAVDLPAVIARLNAMVDLSREVLVELSSTLPDFTGSPARGALSNAVMTDSAVASPEARAKLAWLLGT